MEVSTAFNRPLLPSLIFLLAFDIRPVLLHGRHMQLCLISRRSRFRAGTRYFRRGIDDNGHVANFNESEQILLVESLGTSRGDDFAHKLSFVQIRGSVPLYWAEINTLRYKPDLQIIEKENAVCVGAWYVWCIFM